MSGAGLLPFSPFNGNCVHVCKKNDKIENACCTCKDTICAPYRWKHTNVYMYLLNISESCVHHKKKWSEENWSATINAITQEN